MRGQKKDSLFLAEHRPDVRASILSFHTRQCHIRLRRHRSGRSDLLGIRLSRKTNDVLTETDECPEDPIALNDAFEAEYETDQYEKKLSRHVRQAYALLKK